MRKGFLVMLAVVLVAALAAPAMAGTDINGFYRAKGFVSNFKGYGTTNIGKDVPANAFVEQRLRVKFSFGEENVKAVYFIENDMEWGDSSYNGGAGGAQRNSGGALGADKINQETKNVYVWFKLPNTSLDFTVGLQNQSDSYAGAFLGYADLAGIFVSGKMDPVSYRLGWSKFYENLPSKADDVTLYLAEVKFAPAKDVKVGANLYFLQDDSGRPSGVTRRVYMPGFDATFGAGPATINTFAFYQFGKYADYAAPASTDIDIQGFMFDARGDLNAGPGKAFIEGVFVSGGDNNAKKYKSILTGNEYSLGEGFFARTDMQILLPNLDDLTTSQALVGAGGTGLGNGGRGIMLVAAGYTQKLGDKLTGKVGAGYLQASKLDAAHASYQKKAMGTEVNANVSYNIAKGLDVGLVGAYAWIGDFFKPSATTEADNAYDLHARIQYAF